MKKCKKCGAPLEGFLYNTIGKLMGIKPSSQDPEICNKCVEEPEAVAPKTPEPEIKAETAPVAETKEAPAETESASTEAPVANTEEKKDEVV